MTRYEVGERVVVRDTPDMRRLEFVGLTGTVAKWFRATVYVDIDGVQGTRILFCDEVQKAVPA